MNLAAEFYCTDGQVCTGIYGLELISVSVCLSQNSGCNPSICASATWSNNYPNAYYHQLRKQHLTVYVRILRQDQAAEVVESSIPSCTVIISLIMMITVMVIQ